MKKAILYIMSLICVSVTQTRAQYAFSGNITSSVSVQSVMVLSVTNNTSTSVTLNNAQYSSGYAASNFNTISIKSNNNWTLSVSSATPYFSASGSYSSSNMPASVIGVVKSGQSTFIQLSSTAQQLASGNRGNTTATGNSFNMDFQANPGYNYGPGIYSLTIVYTLAAQ